MNSSPEFIYFMMLYHVFSEFLDDISEDVLPNEATGFKQSGIWNMLYDFQRDAVLAIINKLENYNGCILADSVGLGKTFTALVVIKYYENRNKSVLVLCPKKLAENWNTYKDINDQKATVIIEHITYNVLDEHYDTDIFTEPTIKGRLGVNAMKSKKHLYDHIIYDSNNERDFATDLDTNTDVAVYVKLPNGFYISTPMGHYNPDWAIAFYEGTVKHIYFVAETKGSMSSMQLRMIEESKIHCAREHFKAISGENVVYDVVDSYQSLLDIVTK